MEIVAIGIILICIKVTEDVGDIYKKAATVCTLAIVKSGAGNSCKFEKALHLLLVIALSLIIRHTVYTVKLFYLTIKFFGYPHNDLRFFVIL